MPEIGIKNKDCLIVEGKKSSAPINTNKVEEVKQEVAPKQEMDSKQPSSDEIKVMTADQCWVYRRIIEANDSCLFNAIGYSLLNSLNEAPKLRKVVADRVLADKFLYDSAVLGKSPEDYAKWIQLPESWGGGIELAILSDYLKAEIVAVDIINLRYDIFG